MSLEALLKRRIAGEGPIPVSEYMELCLAHPEFGYYMRRDPFGARGDFITAPEISQMFGELIGVWCASVYQSMGSPPAFALIELGPGRGTLMADILRAAKAAPAFGAAAQVHMVETSPHLRDMQRQALGGKAEWHERLDSVPAGPEIIIANEFFDALPVQQMTLQDGDWEERRVGLDEGGELAFVNGQARSKDVLEISPAREAVARTIARRGGVALIIDYGHAATGPGDTLQAMKAHGFADPLRTPGEADLTAHVDFEALAKAARGEGARVPPAMTQGAFLEAMGIRLRAKRLASSKPDLRGDILAAADRLIAPDQMGKLFKTMTILGPGIAVPYPFEAA